MSGIGALTFSLLIAGASPETPITTGTLLEELADLERLARFPEPGFRTVQFSSYDRRSKGPEAPGWFANADGFGREPIPGFAAVLEEPKGGGPGLYLISDAAGPGAIVRGWSAGMGGVLRVYLDGAERPVWEGPAYEFLARRSKSFFERAGVELDAGDAFIEEDADYFPVPFAKRLRVTWEGRLEELHFYHLQVRLYDAGAPVATFDPEKDLRAYRTEIEAAVRALREPAVRTAGDRRRFEARVEPGKAWRSSIGGPGPGAIAEFAIRLSASRLDEALRRTRLRIAFDGSERPQVEAPVGDFFGCGPGVHAFSSLPVTVRADGTMVSRFVLPFASGVAMELQNFAEEAVSAEGSVLLIPWTWDERSMHFRAKWRADHDLLAGAGAFDVPYLVAIGKGVFAGCAAIIMNPSGVPTAAGNWWGEGDEKFFVDGEPFPSTFGTGSEDYFNYSWSRPDLFDHPYCGQPLCSGPDTSGYVSNHRFQVPDAIPFRRSFAAYLELSPHNRTPGLSYARVAYWYARPGATDDHRALGPSDLRIPELPPRAPVAAGAASGAKFHRFEDLGPEASAGKLGPAPLDVATAKRVLVWEAPEGGRLSVRVPIAEPGERRLHLVLVHRPGGAAVRARAAGKLLAPLDGPPEIALRSRGAPRVLNVHFRPVALEGREFELVLECVEAGSVGLDYLWIQ